MPPPPCQLSEVPSFEVLKAHSAELNHNVKHTDFFVLKEAAHKLACLLAEVEDIEDGGRCLRLEKVIVDATQTLNLLTGKQVELDHLSDAVLKFYFSPKNQQQRQIADGGATGSNGIRLGDDAADQTAFQAGNMSVEAEKRFYNSSAGRLMKEAVKGALCDQSHEKVKLLLARMFNVDQATANGQDMNIPDASVPLPALGPQSVRKLFDVAGINANTFATQVIKSIPRAPIQINSLRDKSGVDLRNHAVALLNGGAFSADGKTMDVATQALFEMPGFLSRRIPLDQTDVQNSAQFGHVSKFLNEHLFRNSSLVSDMQLNSQANGFYNAMFRELSEWWGNVPGREIETIQHTSVLEHAFSVLKNGYAGDLEQPEKVRICEQFRSTLEDLHAQFDQRFSHEEVERAMSNSVGHFLRSVLVAKNDPDKSHLQNDFLAHFMLCLKQGIGCNPATITQDQVENLADSLVSKSVLSKKGGWSHGVSHQKASRLVFEPAPQAKYAVKKTELKEALPDTNASFFGYSRTGLKFRMRGLAQSLSSSLQPLNREILNLDDSISPDTAMKRVAQQVVVKKGEGRQALNYKMGNPYAERLVKERATSLASAVKERVESEEDKGYLNGMFKAQLYNVGVDLKVYDNLVKRSINVDSNRTRMSDLRFSGQMTGGWFKWRAAKNPVEKKAFDKADDTGRKGLRGFIRNGGTGGENVSRDEDGSFKVQMAHRQILWRNIAPRQEFVAPPFEVSADKSSVTYPALDHIGFNEKNLSARDMIRMAEMVLSAVSAKSFLTPLSNVGVDSLYNTIGEQSRESALTKTEFESRLLGNKGKKGPGGIWEHGTLGSQVIDCIADCVRQPLSSVTVQQRQHMGNLLLLVLNRECQLDPEFQRADPGDQQAPANGPFRPWLWKPEAAAQAEAAAGAEAPVRAPDNQAFIQALQQAGHDAQLALETVAELAAKVLEPDIQKAAEAAVKEAAEEAAQKAVEAVESTIKQSVESAVRTAVQGLREAALAAAGRDMDEAGLEAPARVAVALKIQEALQFTHEEVSNAAAPYINRAVEYMQEEAKSAAKDAVQQAAHDAAHKAARQTIRSAAVAKGLTEVFSSVGAGDLNEAMLIAANKAASDAVIGAAELAAGATIDPAVPILKFTAAAEAAEAVAQNIQSEIQQTVQEAIQVAIEDEKKN